MRTPGLIYLTGLGLWLAAAAPAKVPGQYRLGDTVEADIVAPAPLLVVDAEATEALKQKEALKVPALFLHHPEVAAEVEENFRAAFATVRSNFFDAMGAVYQRKRLNEQWLGSTRFRTLAATFKRQHPDFPELGRLIELWAVDNTDEAEAIEQALAARLREAMTQPIRAEAMPPEIELGQHVRVWTVTNHEETLTLDLAETQAAVLLNTNLLALSRARAEFQQSAPPDERNQARYLASFLKPNCVLNVKWTLQSRQRATEHLYVNDRYETGQLIARRGQAVDAKILAALAQLNAAGEAMPRPGNRLPAGSAWWDRLTPWGWAGLLGLLAAGVLIGLSRRRNRKKTASLLPARVAGGGDVAGIISCPSCDETIVIPAEAMENLSGDTAAWQQRALAAEARAERAQAAIRAGVLPQFAVWLKHRFIRGLFAERARMLDAQQSAAAELAELAQRLDELHAPLQERLRAYEKRIAELEKSLAAKGEENRVLLRAKIQMTRKQLETERSRNPAALN